MKKIPVIGLLILSTILLLTSGKTGNHSGSVPCSDFPGDINHDTTGYNRLIEVDSFNLTITPPSSGVTFYRNGIVFLSNTKNEVKMLPKHISFGTIEAYMAQVKDTVLGSHEVFSPSFSFSYPCEAITFGSDFNTMYYTKIPKKDKREKIYHAVIRSNDKNQSFWESDKNPIDFCTSNNTYTHPALSADGKVMIFASDMAGSLGGMDLFISRKSDDKWSAPVNLDKSINTAGNDYFPFLDSEDNLYYSSDGLPGYGGYDVYTCKFNGEAWDKPVNLSNRINSEEDDIAFSINKTDGKSAFFTTRQKSGKHEMQLFKVSLKREVVDNNPISISYVFNGKPPVISGFTSGTGATIIPAESEPVKALTSEVKKEEVKSDEKKPPVKAEPQGKIPEAKVVIIKPSNEVPEEYTDVVIYRVQLLSSTKPKKETEIIVNGKSYRTYEYFYLGSYRYTIGEFITVASAAELQNICRKSGHPQAFVAAFKNNTRSLDLKLFK